MKPVRINLTKKRFFWLTLLVSSIVAVSCLEEPKQSKFNILLICIEDMPPALGCYGDSFAHTPFIDAFSKESVLFEDVHCQVPLCTPSRSSWLTGIRPESSGINKINDDLKSFLPEAVSLPRHFKRNGYFTSLVGKIYDKRSGGLDSAFTKIYQEDGISNNDLVIPALEEAARKAEPFFLSIGYSQAHDPWTPSASAGRHYLDKPIEIREDQLNFHDKKIPQEQAAGMIRDYYGEVTEVDSLIGNVLSQAKKLGMYENTIILVGVFDHGYSLGYHGHWGKGNNRDIETMVPLLIRVPGNDNNGKRTAGITELVDIYPSLIEFCGLPKPAQNLEGISFAKLLQKPNLEWKKAAFTMRAYHPEDRAVKTKDYCYINRKSDGTVQLYNRKSDSLSYHNLASEMPEKVREMQILLEKGPQKLN